MVIWAAQGWGQSKQYNQNRRIRLAAPAPLCPSPGDGVAPATGPLGGRNQPLCLAGGPPSAPFSAACWVGVCPRGQQGWLPGATSTPGVGPLRPGVRY